MIVFADTSALGSAYLGDEADGAWIADVIFGGQDPVVVSEIADIEIASLLTRAERERRIDQASMRHCLDAYADDTADDGPIGVTPLTSETLSRARTLVLQAPVRTLDAIHLAAALSLAESGDEDVALLTRDARQAAAARQIGLALYPSPI